MKTVHYSSKTEQGSTLLVALLISAIMGVTLASYLIMTQAQNTSVARSQTWNAALAATEAGIEDGLALINKYSGNFDDIRLWTNTFASDNWTVLTNGQYYVKRYLDSNNWGTNSYEVFINNTSNSSPTLTAIGYIQWNGAYASSAPQSYFATAGNNTPAPAAQMSKRQVTVQTSLDALFAVAMAALQTINFNGNNATTDSYDSGNPSYSINGLYPMGNPSMIRSNGDVCTDFTIANSVNVGNANIKGKAKTGPNGTVAVGPNGYVTGGIYNDFNVQFPSVTLPSATWVPVPNNNVTVNGVTYPYAITSSGDWWLNGTSSKVYIASNVVCRVYCSGNVSLTGNQDQIRVASGARVKWYQGGTTFSIKGNGIVNNNGNPASFSYYGLPANTSVTFGGNGGFTGSIYAPNADFSLGGGGNNTSDFIGASVTKTVTMNGHFNFHYDEALRRIGPGRGYVPTDWKES